MPNPTTQEDTDEENAEEKTSAVSDLRSLISEVREEVQALREELVGHSQKSQLLTREEAADHLRISTRTLDDMEEAGEIQAVRIRGRVLYHKETLDAFIQNQAR